MQGMAGALFWDDPRRARFGTRIHSTNQCTDRIFTVAKIRRTPDRIYSVRLTPNQVEVRYRVHHVVSLILCNFLRRKVRLISIFCRDALIEPDFAGRGEASAEVVWKLEVERTSLLDSVGTSNDSRTYASMCMTTPSSLGDSRCSSSQEIVLRLVREMDMGLSQQRITMRKNTTTEPNGHRLSQPAG